MANRVHFAMHSILGLRVESVRRSAIEAGGTVSWEFSQVKDPVKTLICASSFTSGGICQMLSTCWIEHHAKDSHLANWITESGSQKIDPNKVRQIGQLHAAGMFMKSGAMTGRPGEGRMSQTEASTSYLATKGIGRRKSIVPANFLREGLVNVDVASHGNRQGRRRDFARELGMNLAGGNNSSYKLIGIEGRHLGHCMAAFVHNDIAFFDPNWGEFWFENKQSFSAWFPTFWHRAGYGNPLVGLSDEYEVVEFEA